MLSELCHELKNWFEITQIFGTFEIKDGVVSVYKDGEALAMKNNQYYRIVGSVFNDGIWQYKAPTDIDPINITPDNNTGLNGANNGDNGDDPEPTPTPTPEPEPTTELVDEIFDGAVWLLAIPREIVALSESIDAWKAKYATADSVAMSPFTSESFGGYSYSKAQGANGASGVSWQSAFASQLNKWRKI